VDSAAVARAVALRAPKRAGWRSAARLGFPVDRRGWALLLALALLAALVGSAVLVGARLFPSPPSVDLRLAYVLDGDVYLADWDGADSARIIDLNPTAACPDMVGPAGLVAPDGVHIAYHANWGDGCPNSVNVADLDGHLVASLPAGVGWDIAWSPDATRIATWLAADGEIGVYGLDGGRQAVLQLPDGYCVCADRDPIWSPDGKSLLLVMTPIDAPAYVVMELPLDGGTPAPVPTDDPRSNQQVAFSPDGARVAFIRFTEEPQRGKLFLAASDGTRQQVLINATPGDILTGSPVWSAASDRVAVVVNRAPGTRLDSDLYLVDVSTGSVSTLPRVNGRGVLGILGFSPEGDRLLVSQDAESASALWSVNTDGSGARQLVAGASVGAWLASPADAEGQATR